MTDKLDLMFGWEKFRTCPVCLLEVPETLPRNAFKRNLMIDPANPDDTTKRWRLIHIECVFILKDLNGDQNG